MPDDEEVMETESGDAGKAKRRKPGQLKGLAAVEITPTEEQLDERQRRMGVFRKEAGPEERHDRVEVGESDVVDVPPTDCDEAPENEEVPAGEEE